MEDKSYLSLLSHYESCLERHGDSHLGVDWPKKEDAETRYRVMLAVIRREDVARTVRLLDFGCGASHLYEHIVAHGIQNITYSGLDLSQKFFELCRKKFPQNDYYCADLLDTQAVIPNFDYIIMNGVFTEKGVLSFNEMFSYFKRLVTQVFEKAEVGIAFNVMTKHVDWERDDLFHLPFDLLAAFLKQALTRNYIIRNDYGLYEYTTYVYR
jgi:cyclopropane fatty-acyl-phospholipid synthase-like methyltransferase